MNEPQPGRDNQREELRRRWIEQAAAAFDLMFDAQSQDQLVTFDQREERATHLGRDLTVWLLEQHLQADAHVRCVGLSPACPKCGKPGQRVTGPDDPLPQRGVTTCTGEVTLQREQWRCTTCRVVFFPPRHSVASGDGGLQPRLPSQGGPPE